MLNPIQILSIRILNSEYKILFNLTVFLLLYSCLYIQNTISLCMLEDDILSNSNSLENSSIKETEEFVRNSLRKKTPTNFYEPNTLLEERYVNLSKKYNSLMQRHFALKEEYNALLYEKEALAKKYLREQILHQRKHDELMITFQEIAQQYKTVVQQNEELLSKNVVLTENMNQFKQNYFASVQALEKIKTENIILNDNLLLKSKIIADLTDENIRLRHFWR